VVHAWALVQPNGSLDLSTQQISSSGPALIAAGHARGVKVLLGIGQPYWMGQTGNLQQAATQYRATLVNNIMNVVNSYGFDGVDIDWEPFSAGTNGAALRSLAADLRSQLGSGKSLSAAAVVTDYTYWGSVSGYFDRIGVMTYDLTGTWNPYSWHNAALYDPDGMVWSLDLAVRRFTANGLPASKLCIGIPFFGYKWSGGGVTGPQQYWSSTPTVQQTYYQNLASGITSSNYRWDSFAKVPYLSMSNQFWTYDNEQSVTEKVNYAKNKGLGGWIIWELSGGYVPSLSPNQPLLTAIKTAMGSSGNYTPPPNTPPPNSPSPAPSGQAPDILTTSLASGTVGRWYSSSLSASGSTPISWRVTQGVLPYGLSLNSATAEITGTPTQSGTFLFVIQASNASGSTTQQLSISVRRRRGRSR
jgi:chitinase